MCYGLKEETIEKINAVFKRYDNIETVLIYGSRAMGNYKRGSDIDLTIKGRDLDMETLNRISSELDELLLPYTIDLSLFRQIDNKNLIDHIQRVGKPFQVT